MKCDLHKIFKYSFKFQIVNNEENATKKVVTSGGYLIVGGGSGNQPLVTPRRQHTIQYYT